jgi:hypothetical protein
MTSSSEKARPAHRTACFIILAALLLAIVSNFIPDGREAPAAVTASPSAVAQQAPKRPVEPQAPVRNYHAEETSNKAGAFGFWLLFSLWAVLLAAGLAPRLLKTGRGSSEQKLPNGRLTVR